MKENIQLIQELVKIFIDEASSAVALLSTVYNELPIIREVTEGIIETNEIICKIKDCSNYSEEFLKDINWQMHIVCSKLYLNIQRVPRENRDIFTPVITEYKTMMFHFSFGQAQVFPTPIDELFNELVHHINILNTLAINEINRLSINKKKYLNEFIDSLDLSDNNTNLVAQFKVFIDNLKLIADEIGEPADTLVYLTVEYEFLCDKINSVLSIE